MDYDKSIADLQVEMASAREQHKTIFRRLEKVEELTDSVQSLALSVRDLANAQKNAANAQDKVDKKLDKLCATVDGIKQEPAQKWKTVTADMLKILVAAVAGFLLSRLGL